MGGGIGEDNGKIRIGELQGRLDALIDEVKTLSREAREDANSVYGKMDTLCERMNAKVGAVEKSIGALPCRTHGERLAKLEVKAGVWGAIGAAVVLVAAWVKEKMGL